MIERVSSVYFRYAKKCCWLQQVAMANLNFTRNIGGSSLGRSTVGFGANPMSGHVTPVFGQRAPSDRRGLPTIG